MGRVKPRIIPEIGIDLIWVEIRISLSYYTWESKPKQEK
jgi:hypothetical protein